MSDLQFDNVDFTLYSKRVVDCVDSHIDDNSEFGCIISACKLLLDSSFQNSYVEFNMRQANEVAYELAHAAPFNSHFIDDVSSCI